MPGVEGAACDQRVAEIDESGEGAAESVSSARGALDHRFIDHGPNVANERLSQRRPPAVSRVYTVLPAARRQREHEAPGHQGLEKRIATLFAKRDVNDCDRYDSRRAPALQPDRAKKALGNRLVRQN
jgi:hypothetical protein